jgi:copper oxidase (laccase) domain-containing protein
MNCIIQKQCHSSIINRVSIETPPWEFADGMITYEKNLALIVYGADCSILVFWDHEKIGACHAGWRGLASGIIDSMVKQFPNGKCYVGPLLHTFEIQKDDCYRNIFAVYGEKYFYKDEGRIIFEFRNAVLDRVKPLSSIVDSRNTMNHSELASWRRDQKRGDGTQNRLTIWRTLDDEVHVKFFYPGEAVKNYFEQIT